MEELVFILALLTAYYLVERGIKFMLRQTAPGFLNHLYASHKLPVFTGIAMGALITVATAPSCIQSALNTTSDSLFHTEICFTGRGVLWVSELNRLDLYELYVIHHLGGLLALFSTVILKWPFRPLSVIFASLLSEIPGDCLWLLSAYQDYRSLAGSSPAYAGLHTSLIGFNLVQYTLLRFPAMWYSFHILKTGWKTNGMDVREFLEAYAMMIAHAAFCLAYVRRQYKTLRKHLATGTRESSPRRTPSLAAHRPFLTIHTQHQPYHVQLNARGTRWFFTVYGLLMGLGLAALTMTVSILCPSFQAGSLMFVVISAILGARLFSLIFEDGLRQVIYNPLSTILRPGFWLHGGIAGAALASIHLHSVGAVTDLLTVGGSLAVGLPLFEFFSRIGCHCYGCCYGKPYHPKDLAESRSFWFVFPPVIYRHPSSSALARTRPSWVGVPLIPIQLASAIAFLCLFLGVAVPLIVVFQLSVSIVGCIVLIGHTSIRLLTETYRSDYRGEGVKAIGFSTTALLSLVQMLGAICSLMWIWKGEAANTDTALITESLTQFGKPAFGVSLFSFLLGAVVYGVHQGEIGRWV